MVKALFLLFFCWWSALGAEPIVETSIDPMKNQAHFPLQGIITITHQKEEVVDPQSFTLEGKSLDALLTKEVKMSASSDTLVSIYSFQLPAQEKGLYLLPSIAVKIGGKVYYSTPSSYEVQAAEKSQHPTKVSTAGSPTLFRLEASVEGSSILYPGERTKLRYRILYNRNVDLTRSELPMIHPEHFLKVGDVQIKEDQLQEITVQELTQEVEASELGTFSFGPSLIEGYAYRLQAGKKIYEPTLLQAEAPIVTLEVKPFPSQMQPPSFTGALGQIEVLARLLSPHTLAIGDSLHLLLEIKGATNLADVHLPSLQCQPGFNGFFQFSENPPLSEVKDKAKLFYIEMRPLATLIHHIPAIEVSSFDPESGAYVIQKSSPISITVTASPISLPSLPFIPLFTQALPTEKWPSPTPPSLEIKGSLPPYVTDKQVKGIWIMGICVLACFLLWLQHAQKRKREIAKSQAPLSEKLFKQALKEKDVSMLEQAFWYRLWEKGKVPQGIAQIDKIAHAGTLSSVYSFLFELQALQYSPNKTFDDSQLQKAAKENFELI